MSPTGRPPPIARFLGAPTLSRGPFGLLGVEPDRCETADIRSALDRQLVRIEQHPEGDTPEADEVRLALHAAAAQLLDPEVRWHLLAGLQRAPALSAEPSPPSPPPSEPRPEPTRIVAPNANRGEIRGVAAALIAMAVLIGIAGSVLLVLLSRNDARRAAAAAKGTVGPAAPVSPATPATIARPATSAAPSSTTSKAPTRPTDVIDVTLSLRRCAEQIDTTPDQSKAQFAQAVAWLEANWTLCPLPQRRAANDAVVEVVYAAAGRPASGSAVVEIIAAGSEPLEHSGRLIAPDEVWPAAWSCGMLSRLARERGLSSQLSTAIDRALVAAMGQDRPRTDLGFEAGAAAALAQMPLRLLGAGAPPGGGGEAGIGTDPAAATQQWVGAVSALAADPLVHERILVEGLETILVSGPAPQADAGAFASIRTLTMAIKWRRGGPARAMLLRWLGDQRVSPSGLHLVTSTIATETGAEGVGPNLVLSATSGGDDRARIRGLYASAWGLAGSTDDAKGAEDWQAAVALVLERSARRSADERADLAAAAEMARLHLAARLRRSGDTGASAMATRSAQDVLAGLAGGQPGMPAGVLQIFTSAGDAGGGEGGDGQWAATYIAAGQNIPVRLERLAELERSGQPLGPVDAAILAEAACFAQGGDGRVRAAAQRVATLHAREPVMAYVMLELLPRAPRVESVSTLIGAISSRELPPAGDPSWMSRARRSLLERLIEQLAGAGRMASVDRLAEMLVRAYESREFQAAPLDSQTGPDLGTSGIEGVWVSLRAQAEALAPNRAAPIPLANIESRRSGRRALASGPIQAWGAEQASVAELLAFVVSGEHPGAADRVRAIVDDMMNDRRAAAHIFEQLKVTERAMLRLWLVRLGKEDVWPPG